MLKTTRLLELASKAFRADKNQIITSGGSRANRTIVNLSKNKKSKKSTCMSNIRATREPNFLTSNAKKTFNQLQLAFIRALILQHFDLKSYIWIEIDALGYAIGRVLSQLNFDFNALSNDSNKFDFGQWHLVAYFFRKIILAKIWYKTHNA